MGDTLTNLPQYDPDEIGKQAKNLLFGLQAAPLGVLSNIIPPAWTAPSQHWTDQLPLKGLGTYLGSTALGLGELGINTIGRGIGNVLERAVTGQSRDPGTWINIPGHDALTESNERTTRDIVSAIPHVQPTTEGQQLSHNIGLGVGQALSSLTPPGLGLLPKAAAVPAQVLTIPRTVGGVAVGGGLGGVAGGLVPPEGGSNLLKPLEDESNLLQPLIEAPGQPGPNNDSGLTYPEIGALAVIGGATLWGMSKVGPSVVNTAADKILGRIRNVDEANTALAKGLATGTGEAKIEMPLPGDAGGATRRWAANNLNPNAVLNKFAESTMPEPQAKLQVAVNEVMNNPANANRRMESLFRTGVEEGTGHTFPKIIDYKRATDLLTPEQKALADRAAWARSEVELRQQNALDASKRGTPLVDEDIRVSFKGTDTNTLLNDIRKAEADPQVKAWLDMHKSIPDAIVDSMLTRGHITPGQAAHAKKAYANFMPTIDETGRFRRSWDDKIRDPGSGFDSPPTTAWEAMIGHFDRSIREAQHNDWKRGIVLEYYKKQQADPSLPRILKETRTPTATPGVKANDDPVSTLNKSITINTASGQRHFDVYNTSFWRSLQQQSPQMTSVTNEIGNWLRRLYQNTTTGPLGTVLGSPFVIKNVLRDTMLLPAQAGKGMARGEIDRALGIRLPYDPTFPIGVGTTMGRDIGAVTVKNFADMMGNPQHPLSAFMRNVAGDQKVDTFTDWMRMQYAMSRFANREAIGVGGGGNRTPLKLSSDAADAGGTYRDPTANSVSPFLSPGWMDKIADRVPIPGQQMKQGATAYLNLRSWARDLYSVISDAPHSYMFDVNIGNPKIGRKELAAEVQRMSGDPGTMGLGRTTQWAARNIPWYNTSLQAIAASGRAVRDRPIATGATIASLLIPFAVAEHLSALVSGKEHMDHLENETSNSSKAREARFYHGPGTDPNEHTKWPMPQEWMVFWPYISGGVGHMVGTWNAHDDQGTLERLTTMLSGLADQHVSMDTMQQVGIGATAGYVPVDLPVATGLGVAALTGQEVKNMPEQLMTNAITGAPTFANLAMGGAAGKMPPGQGGHDSMLFRADSGVLKSVLGALGAQVGAAYDMATGFDRRAKVDPEWDWAKEGLWRDYKQEWRDNTPYANFVWKDSLPQSTFGSLQERTNRAWYNIKDVGNVGADLRGEGMSKSTGGAIPLLMNAPAKVPDDPAMRVLYLTIGDTVKVINKEIEPRISEIRAQMESVKKSPYMPEEKRRMGQNLSYQLYQMHAKKHEWILNLNAKLSQMSGRTIDVGQRIDWQGTVEQFD